MMAMLSVAVVAAQNITFTQGDKGNGKGYQPTLLRVDKAIADGHYYSVEPDLNAFSKVKGILVREVDINYKEVRSVEVPNCKGANIYHVQRDGGRMHVLINNYEKKRYTMRHVCVDLESFAIVADSMLVDSEIGKKQYFLNWSSISASGEYFGYVYAFVDEKEDRAEMWAMVFDRSMRRQWTMPLRVSALSQVLTTDDGRLATVGATNVDDGAMVEFSITSATGTHRGRYTSTRKLGEMTVLNVFGDKVLATALETDRGTGWAGSFTAGSVITTGTIYTGIASYLFDVVAGSMVGSDRHEFAKADARVFYNASLVSEITSPDVNFLSLRAKATTQQGGVALYGRTWFEKVVNTKNAMSQSTYYYKGMMVVGADSTGRITWMKPLMHDNFLNGDFGEYTETDMVADGDDVYIVTNESHSDGDTYDPDNAAKRAVVKGHGIISAYRFGADGSVSKRKLTDSGVSVIMTRMRNQGDGLFTLVTGSRKGCISEIKISK